jgi:hypothetical protein
MRPLHAPLYFFAKSVVVKEGDVFVARTGDAADTDFIDHIDVALRFAAGPADIESCRHAALEHVDNGKPLADVYVL